MKTVKTGINWNFYYADSYDEAVEYFKELTGVEPYASNITKDADGKFSFRLHIDVIMRLIEKHSGIKNSSANPA